MGLESDRDSESVRRAATLLSQLPREARVIQREVPDALWDEATQILALIELDLQAIHYAITGGKGQKPAMVKTPSERVERERSIQATLDEKEEVDRVLAGIMPGRR